MSDPARGEGVGLAGFLLGAGGMFATMYSTQAILPELSRDLDVTPSRAGLTVSAVVISIALSAWLWGPLSDRIGRPAAIRLASLALVAPSVWVALAPSFEWLLVGRVLQGLCMPGLLVVGAPYVVETIIPRVGARAMGWYVGALVAGGLVGRVGVALATSVVGWRWALGALALLPLIAALAMRGALPAGAPVVRAPGALQRVVGLPLAAVTVTASALFFSFVGVFSYTMYRLLEPPFSLEAGTASLVFLLWVSGAIGPVAGRVAERVGWWALAALAVALALAGVGATLSGSLPVVVVGLACLAAATFAGYTAANLGVSAIGGPDRAVASGLFFSVYYGAGALGAYLPGLAWEGRGWGGVVGTALAALALSVAALAVLARRFARPIPLP